MGRIRQGWELTKKSWALLRGNRQLFRFPIVGALVALAIVAVLCMPGLYLMEDGSEAVGAVLFAVGVYGATFVSIYFSVGLAAAAGRLFEGEDATYAEGMAVARSRTSQIAGWAAVSALVGAIVSALQRGGSIGEAIAAVVIGTAWSLISFMSIPVLAFEGPGPWATLKRSAAIFKERWVGQVTGNIAIGGIVFLVGVLPGALLTAAGIYIWAGDDGGAGLAGGAILVAVGVVVLTVALLISQAMRSVFGVALYRYASTGTASATFTEEELRNAVRTR